MPNLSVFNNVTLDGYFSGQGGDLRWAHAGADDPEYQAFVAENAKGGGVLVFGRVTYQMMAGWWPTPAAAQMDPVLATRMNALPKVVFSGTLAMADWANTTLVRGDAADEMRRRKAADGPDMVILGSGRLVAALAREGLIDEYQLLVNPVVLGRGRTMFEGLERPLSLALVESRAFRNGKVFLRYAAEEVAGS
jgi:dihydrofolate reductase